MPNRKFLSNVLAMAYTLLFSGKETEGENVIKWVIRSITTTEFVAYVELMEDFQEPWVASIFKFIREGWLEDWGPLHCHPAWLETRSNHDAAESDGTGAILASLLTNVPNPASTMLNSYYAIIYTLEEGQSLLDSPDYLELLEIVYDYYGDSLSRQV